jgi:hypothetical protein
MPTAGSFWPLEQEDIITPYQVPHSGSVCKNMCSFPCQVAVFYLAQNNTFVEHRFANGESGYVKLGTVTMVTAAPFTQLATTTMRQIVKGIQAPFMLCYQTKDRRIHKMVQTAPDNIQYTVRWESGIGLYK